jgi:GTP-binding protein
VSGPIALLQPTSPLKTEATFVTSAAGGADMPHPERPEVAMVGRSNVGKSSLINALVRQKLARTSAAAGKTRLANFYRVARGRIRVDLIDLPGFGYARGGGEFDELAQAVFERGVSAILLVDCRHPGLKADRDAWEWLRETATAAIVVTKIDKLPRGQRIRALRELESVFGETAIPVSAVTGEGLDELWKLIDRLANNSRPLRRSPGRDVPLNRSEPRSRPPRAPMRGRRSVSSASTSPRSRR